MLRILLGALVSGSIHFVVWWRLVKPAQLPRRVHWTITIAMIVLWLLIPITTTSRLWAPALSRSLSWVTMPWMALIGLSLIAVVALELSRLFARAGRLALRKPAPQGYVM